MNLTTAEDLLQEANRYVAKNKAGVNPRYRHQFHLMAPIGWINDPNGVVYFKGEYHVFYQHNPFDSAWGPMFWGHAKSKDLIHWQELPIALAPDQWYDLDGCFSGSAIEKEGKLYLLYTGHRVIDGQTYQRQCLAVSDDGIHFSKSAQNPVIAEELLGQHGEIKDFRDPKVFQKGDKYYTVVASKTPQETGRILLFSSDNLTDWQFVSVVLEGTPEQGIMWECPDLFHLDGSDVLIISPIQMPQDGLEYHNISSTVAFIGEMDWQTGKFQTENYHEIDRGFDFYAPQTLEDDKKRRIMIAWMQLWDRAIPSHDLGHGWSGAMTLPRELKVKNQRLIQKPISEIYANIEYLYGVENLVVAGEALRLKKIMGDNTYLQLVCDLSASQGFVLELAKNQESAIRLSYDKGSEILTLSRENFGYELLGAEKEPLVSRSVQVPLINQCLTLEIFRDTASLEIFANALETLTMTFYEKTAGQEMAFEAEGQLTIQSLEIGRVI
ncbi:glycoside hydrolase family 32 protein [Enterococcus sp. LJL90]